MKLPIVKSLISTFLLLNAANALSVDSHPRVSDWREAEWFNGLIKIPLRNPNGHTWFASLQMGTPLQYEQVCVIDSNNAYTMTFSKNCANCPHGRYLKDNSTSFKVESSQKAVTQSDGYRVEGIAAQERMCLGMFGTHQQFQDPHTTVCMDQQPFFLVENTVDWNWSAKATDVKYFESICGLGKEDPSEDAQGIIARAVNQGSLKNNTYSVALVPQVLAGAPVSDPMTGPEYLRKTSFLVLGGWDKEDYSGEINWLEAPGEDWNQTATSFKFKDREILEKPLQAMFEVGYPYIGLSNSTYVKVAQILEQEVEGMSCTQGQHWGLCRVKERNCEDLDLDYEISVTIEDFEFKIPLKNIAVYLKHSQNGETAMYCSMQIASLGQSEDGLILGGAFFTAFLGIFDVENKRLGLAHSTRALPGSLITCLDAACRPDQPGSKGQSELEARIKVAVICIALVIVALASCLIVTCVKNRRERSADARRVTERSMKGKKGYDIQAEKEEDSGSDSAEELES